MTSVGALTQAQSLSNLSSLGELRARLIRDGMAGAASTRDMAAAQNRTPLRRHRDT